MGNKLTFTVWLAAFLTSLTIVGIAAGTAFGLDLVPSSIAHLIDRGPITAAILVVFAIGLVFNAFNTLFVLRQLSLTAQGVTQVRLRNREKAEARGLLGLHIDRLYDMYADSSSAEVSQASCLNAVRNQLFRREWIVRSASGLLLTLGLVGTVLGLTDSLSGLSSTVSAVAPETLISTEKTIESSDSQTAEDSESMAEPAPEMSAGLNRALGGMASAFATTLFGAALGGIFLKLLCGCTDCLIEEVVDQIEMTTETRVIPLLRQSPEEALRRQERAFRRSSKRMEEAAARECQRLAEVSQHLAEITRRFTKLSQSIAEAESRLANSESHLALLSGMNGFVSKWESVTRSKLMKTGVAACCILSTFGAVRLITDFLN